MATKSTTQRVIEVVDDTAGGMQSLTRQGAGAVKAAAAAAQNPTAPAPILGEVGMDLPARAENATLPDAELAEMLRVLQHEGLAELLRALAELDLGDAELSLESLADDMVRGRSRRGGVARAMVLSQLMQFWLQQQTPQFPKFTPAQQQQFLQIQQTAKVFSAVVALPAAQQAQRVAQILSDPKFAQNLHMAVRQISGPITTTSPRPSINVLAQAMVIQAMAPMRAAPTPTQAQNMAARPVNMVVLARALVPALAVATAANTASNRPAILPALNQAAVALQNFGRINAVPLLNPSLRPQPVTGPVPVNLQLPKTVAMASPRLAATIASITLAVAPAAAARVPDTIRTLITTTAPAPMVVARADVVAPAKITNAETARFSTLAGSPPRADASPKIPMNLGTINTTPAAAPAPIFRNDAISVFMPATTVYTGAAASVARVTPTPPANGPSAMPRPVSTPPIAVVKDAPSPPRPAAPTVVSPPDKTPPVSARIDPPKSSATPAVNQDQPANPATARTDPPKPSESPAPASPVTPPASAPPTKDQPPPSAPPQPVPPLAPPQVQPPVQSLQDVFKQQNGKTTTQPIPTEVADCCKDKKPKTVFSTSWNFVKGGFGLTKLFARAPKTAPESAFAIFERNQPQR